MSKIGYKEGYIPHNKKIQIERKDFKGKNYFRPDHELLNSISETDYDVLVHDQDTDSQDVNVGFVRPLSTQPSVLESHQIRESPVAKFETNRICHPVKVQELWNFAISYTNLNVNQSCSGIGMV